MEPGRKNSPSIIKTLAVLNVISILLCIIGYSAPFWGAGDIRIIRLSFFGADTINLDIVGLWHACGWHYGCVQLSLDISSYLGATRAFETMSLIAMVITLVCIVLFVWIPSFAGNNRIEIAIMISSFVSYRCTKVMNGLSHPNHFFVSDSDPRSKTLCESINGKRHLFDSKMKSYSAVNVNGNELSTSTLPSKILNVDSSEKSPSLTYFKKVCLEYDLQAFPKLKDLLGEYRKLKGGLQKLFSFFEAVILMSDVQNFVYADVLQNPEIRHVYVNVIDTEENIDVIKKLVSTEHEPRKIQDINFKNNCDPLDSFLHSPPEVFICWITKDLNQTTLQQVFEYLRKIDSKARKVFVTDSETNADVKEQLRQACNTFDAPTACYSIQKNIRKDVTFTLSEFIFERLSVLKEILLTYKENVSILLSNLTDAKRQLLSDIVQNQVMPNKEPPEKNGPDVSDVDRQLLSNLLETKLFHVISLQQENPKKANDIVYKDIPQDLIDKLKSLKVRGVEAFGLLSDEFRVYINCKHLTEDEIKEVKKEICRIIPDEFKKILRPIRCEDQIIVKYVENGDKLFRDGSNTSKYGTLGIFARDSSDDLVALTSEHVIDEGQTAYVDIDGTRVVLGDCHQTTALDKIRHSSDISLIKIRNCNYLHCNTAFKGKTGERVQPELFTGQNVDLHYRRVYKKGATSNLTEGIVNGIIYQTADGNSIQSIIVKGIQEEFCKNGDSGSVVFTYDIHDPENNRIHLVSMVVGGIEGSDNEVLTYRLDETLNRLQPNAITFYHQN